GLNVGQTLTLPGGGTVGAPQVASAAPQLGAPEKPLGQLRVSADGAPLAASQAPAPQPSVAQVKPPAPPSIPVQNPQVEATTVSVDAAAADVSSDGKSFRWPVRGRIIAGFGSKPNGERNDGINLA